jgi:hypothetical protein
MWLDRGEAEMVRRSFEAEKHHTRSFFEDFRDIFDSAPKHK